jgi:membrane protein YdbS with pleckstrin-like domain
MVRGFSREGMLLFAICAFDALSTWAFLVTRTATEANPVLAHAASVSPQYFLIVKLMTFVPAIALAEWYRRRNPNFVRMGLRVATTVYVTIYGLFVVPQLLLKVLPHWLSQ